VLALAPEGEAAQLIGGLRRGIVAPQEDERALARTLSELYDGFADGTLDGRFDLSHRPEFTREALAGKLADLLDNLTGGGAKAGDR
jgi:hypothetical protein